MTKIPQGELNGEGVSVAGVDNVFVSGLGGRCEPSKVNGNLTSCGLRWRTNNALG